jgi:hypothetical protein
MDNLQANVIPVVALSTNQSTISKKRVSATRHRNRSKVSTNIEMQKLEKKSKEVEDPVVVDSPSGLVHKNTNIYKKNNGNENMAALERLSCQSK